MTEQTTEQNQAAEEAAANRLTKPERQAARVMGMAYSEYESLKPTHRPAQTWPEVEGDDE